MAQLGCIGEGSFRASGALGQYLALLSNRWHQACFLFMPSPPNLLCCFSTLIVDSGPLGVET